MSIDKAAAWEQLASSAKAFSGAAPEERALLAQKLSDAAKTWAGATKEKPAASKAFVIPFGRSKGVELAEATTKDLEWVAGALRNSIDDPAKARWKAGNEELLNAIEEELESR